jgi:hypothetical protein
MKKFFSSQKIILPLTFSGDSYYITCCRLLWRRHCTFFWLSVVCGLKWLQLLSAWESSICTVHSHTPYSHLPTQKQNPTTRWKIRRIESNAKCRYLKKLTCKGTLQQVFYLSDVPSLPIIPYYTVYLCMYNILFTRGRANQREGAIAHKHDWLYLQSINSI